MPDIEHWPLTRLLSTAARLVELIWDDKIRGLGLTFASVIALEAVANTGPVSQNKLAGIIRVQPQSLGPTLTRLENRGLIKRSRSQLDRRIHTVAITPTGREILAQARDLEHSALEELPVNTTDLREELTAIVQAPLSPVNPRRHEPLTVRADTITAKLE